MSNYPKADKAMTKAKVAIMCTPNTVFISTILFNLKQSWNPKIETARTNGVFLQINPDWFVGLEPDERVGLLAHECWHVAWNHMQRGKDLEDRSRYNKAGDHIINLTLTDANMKIPPDGLCDTQYRGMSTGEVYKALPPTPPGTGKGDGGGNGDAGSDDIVYSNGDEEEAVQTQVQNTIVKATVQSKMSGDQPGTIPGELQRLIDAMINPKLPWNAVLSNFMNAFAKADYSFKKPNKRFFPEFYLPSAYSERLENISALIDLSGSITDTDLSAFLSEIQYIHGTMKPDIMRIGGFDTRLTDLHEVTEFQDVRDLKFHGGGGTSLDWMPKFIEKDPPTVMIIFTDMYVDIPPQPNTNTHFIWIIIDNEDAHAPYGQEIHYTTDDR